MSLLSHPSSGVARNDRLALLLLSGLALAIIPLGALFAQTAAQRPYTVVETGHRYGSLQEAVDAIGDASGTIRIASGRWRDCAVQTKGSVAYVAQVAGQAALDGGVCEGKAALVLRGRSARVEGLIFANLRVPEYNGAGIRLEHGDLAVSQSWFMDSNQGILTAEDPGGSILIEKSTFTRLGTCEGAGGCAHSIYIGLRRADRAPLPLRAGTRRALCEKSRRAHRDHPVELRRFEGQGDQLHDRPARRRERDDRGELVRARPGQRELQRVHRGCGGGQGA